MRRALATASLAGSLLASTPALGAKPAPPSPRDLELARWIDVLEELEVLEDLEVLELMPVLESEDED